MSSKTLLIDGMYLIFNSFYSHKNMRTLKGEPTGAVFGFITRVESLIRELKPDYLVIALDSRTKTFRHEMYEPYKAKRLAPPEELLEQIAPIKEYLAIRAIDCFEVPGFEADDIIAQISNRENTRGNQVIIFSADKDLFQLVRENIFIFHPKLKKMLDQEGILDHFGIKPAQIVDYLSLTGDSSDNIPGIPGIGDKTAKKLLQDFNSLPELLENLDQAGAKIEQKIKDNQKSLELARKLVDLKQCPSIREPLDLNRFRDEIVAELIDFFQKLSFNSLVRSFEKRIPQPVAKKEQSGLKIEYHIVKSLTQLKELREKILQQLYFAFDIETTAVEFYLAEVAGISISFPGEGYYIPFVYPSAEAGHISLSYQDFKTVFKDLFADPKIKKIGHNLKFDILILKQTGIEVRGRLDDSMLMSYLLFPNRRSHKLKDLTLEILSYKQTAYLDLAQKKGSREVDFSRLDLERAAEYCIDDSCLSLKLVEVLGKKLAENKLQELYETMEIPLIPILSEMEFTGVKLDLKILKGYAEILKNAITRIEQEIRQAAGYDINVDSAQQLGVLLFEKMQLPVIKKTRKTQAYSTDNETLRELQAYPVVQSLIRYRKYKKLYSTYLVGLMNKVDRHQRIHTSYNQTITATGRLSSSAPNLQNIPVGSVEGINVRSAFTAGHRTRFLAADYSQIELRVMAHFSRDPNLQKAFVNNLDIHRHTAGLVFGSGSSLPVTEQRRRAKIINFSIIYGSGPFSLAKELGISYSDARDFIDNYFTQYSGVKEFIEKVIREAKKNPVVETIFHRKRHIPEIQSSNRNVAENGKRMAVNTIIQGSAADIIKMAMIKIFDRIRKMETRMILQVHDELVFEYPVQEEKELEGIVKKEMEGAIQLRVPLKIDLKKGSDWGSLV